MTKEKTIQGRILKKIPKKFPIKLINIKANGTENGTPDILGSIFGRNVVIELKNENPKEKELQRYRIYQWVKEGGSAAIYADSYDYVQWSINIIANAIAVGLLVHGASVVLVSEKLTLTERFEDLIKEIGTVVIYHGEKVYYDPEKQRRSNIIMPGDIN